MIVYEGKGGQNGEDPGPVSYTHLDVYTRQDRFGLSQLYQLRGRVGRSNRLAYAYLTVNPAKVLTETADKRLAAIREFTE